MSTTPQRTSDDQEIDLSQISQRVNNGFKKTGNLFFNGFRFMVKNAIILTLLVAAGIGIGYFVDNTKKSYDHEIIVIPNFGSSDYLYGKIDLINAKIKEKDTAFLKSLGLKFPASLSKISIEPIVDPYNFIRDREENFELLKLMAEDGSMEKVLKDRVTSKNYAFHMISFTTKGKATNESTIAPLLASLNQNQYFKVLQKNVIENVKVKIQYNEQTLNQINAILNSFSNEVNGKNARSGNLVYYNENTQLDEVLKAKYDLVSEQGNRRIELLNYEKIVKEVSVVSNIEKPSAGIFIVPLVLVALFIMVKLLFDFYKKQSLKLQ